MQRFGRWPAVCRLHTVCLVASSPNDRSEGENRDDGRHDRSDGDKVGGHAEPLRAFPMSGNSTSRPWLNDPSQRCRAGRGPDAHGLERRGLGVIASPGDDGCLNHAYPIRMR